ncbi:regulator, BldB [Streptomyces aureoverticillatus]|nr:regulator, BldB [Streptomyces aureoverticillatus]
MAEAQNETQEQGPARESEQDVKARKEREKNELYALDISGVEWHCAPGTETHEERVEIAYLPGGAVAMRSSLEPQTVLRYTEAEWTAFVLGARDGEFDLEPSPRDGGTAAE